MLIYYFIYILILMSLIFCYYLPSLTIIFIQILGIILIVFAGFRWLGSDHDMNNYLYVFDHVFEYSDTAFINMDPMAVWLPVSLKKIGIYSLSSVFLCFAILGVIPQFKAMLKYSPLPLLSCLMFYSFIYFKQEFNQIRAGVASGLFMWAIQDVYNKNIKLFLTKIGIACLFHLSAMVYFPIYFFNPNKLNKKIYMGILSFIILITLLKINLLAKLPILSFISDKIDSYVQYDQLEINGKIDILYIGNLINISITFLLLSLHDTLTKYSKNATLFIKLNFVAISNYVFLSIFATSIASRIYDLFLVPALLTTTYFIYLVKPKWMMVVILIAYSAHFYWVNISLLYPYQFSQSIINFFQ